MNKMRKTTQLEREVLEYLNDLRESGVTNMFGAGSYIEDEFETDRSESRRLLRLWMDNFNNEGKYDEVKDGILLPT